jgi:hypothetical protein
MRLRAPSLAVLLAIVSPAVVQAQEQVPTPPLARSVASCPASTDDLRAIVERTAANDEINDKRARDYTYTELQTEQDLDKSGKIHKSSTETHEIMILDDEYVERLVAKDGQPLPPKEAQKEDERINKWLEKRKNESPDEKRDRLAKGEKEREKDREFVREIADAYYFKALPDETIGGRDAFVISAEPRPDFKPHTPDARFLPKFRFRAWIDKSECQLIKLDADVIGTVSVGFFVARLYPGSRFELEQTRVNDEVWLPSHIDVRLVARVLLVKGFNENLVFDYSDYKKFRSNIQILPAADH